MSFKKIQLISPLNIGNPEDGYIYFGRDDFGLWEKYSNGYYSYITTGTTASGTAGTAGSSGKDGIDGSFMGSSGTSGTSGLTGTSGISGSSGKDGKSGTSGTSGTTGTTGTSGSSGITGTSGTTGSSGITGTSGSSGLDGNFYGSSGTSGSSGLGSYGGSARRWTFSTSAYPSQGYFYAYGSNYDLTNIDYVRINEKDADGKDVSNWLSSWTNGILKIELYQDLSVFGIYSILTGTTTNTNPVLYVYQISGLTLYSASGMLSDGEDYIISYVPSSINNYINSQTTTLQGTGTSVSPLSDSWSWGGMYRVQINGNECWIPYFYPI